MDSTIMGGKKSTASTLLVRRQRRDEEREQRADADSALSPRLKSVKDSQITNE